MKLTDTQIRSLVYKGGVHKVRDGAGLYVHLMKSGKYFRADYRFKGKRKTLALGVYPDVSLKAARLAWADARVKLSNGIDPSYEKQIRKHVTGEYDFQSIAQEWIVQHDCTDRSRNDITQRLAKDAFPIIGGIHVAALGPVDILNVLRRIESRGALDVARKVCTDISQVMRYSIYLGIITSDPCRDLRGALKRKRQVKRYPAIVEPEAFGQLLRDIDRYDGNLIIAHALQISPHLALRPTEIREGNWSEIDFEKKEWSIGRERMKKDRPHRVPLTEQSIKILQSLYKITGPSGLMFPSPVVKNQAISDGTVRAALCKLGYAGLHCPHGFRSTFSTLANQSGLFLSDAIESQLSHMDKDAVRAAYNRAEHWDARVDIMQWWSEQVDTMRLCPPPTTS